MESAPSYFRAIDHLNNFDVADKDILDKYCKFISVLMF